MEEEANIEQAALAADQIEQARKTYNAQKQRERTARLRALGLNARGQPLKKRSNSKRLVGAIFKGDGSAYGKKGKPKKDRHPNRDAEKQLKYQANFSARHKAARENLGLTIAEFNKLPREARQKEYDKLKGKPAKPVFTVKGALAKDKAERNRELKRDWYHRNKGKVAAARRNQNASNGVLPADDRSVKFCPHCGWNIDATRKAQAFVDGRVS